MSCRGAGCGCEGNYEEVFGGLEAEMRRYMLSDFKLAS